MRFKPLLFGLILLVSGCAFMRQVVAPRATAYSLMVKPWHRYAVLKSDLVDMLASVDVVFLSCDLQKAMVEYEREAEVITDLEAQLKEREIENTCSAYYDFLVALYTKNSSWNNLDEKRPFFRVFLVTSQGMRRPQLVQRLELKDDEIETFYPFVEPWMKVYKVRFGRAGLEGEKSLKLVFTSLMGKLEVSWSLQ